MRKLCFLAADHTVVAMAFKIHLISEGVVDLVDYATKRLPLCGWWWPWFDSSSASKRVGF